MSRCIWTHAFWKSAGINDLNGVVKYKDADLCRLLVIAMNQGVNNRLPQRIQRIFKFIVSLERPSVPKTEEPNVFPDEFFSSIHVFSECLEAIKPINDGMENGGFFESDNP